MGILLLVLLLTACGAAATAVSTPPTNTLEKTTTVEVTAVPTPPTNTLEETTSVGVTAVPINIDLVAIPPVDMTQHSVPLDEIYFDTFRAANRAVPLNAADNDLIQSLRDAIPPIYNPVFEEANQADNWLREDDLVLGYADGNAAYAYPIRILNFHEIVSHEVNGRPLMATYCPLCRSGVLYDRRLNGEELLFGNSSALYESDMVMLDHQTGSYWVQVSGEAVVGPLTDERLTLLPSQTTTWGQWKAQYPHTLSLSRDTGQRRDYSRDPFAGYAEQVSDTGRFAFPVSEAGQDPRLKPGAVVLGVQVGEQTAVYPLAQLGDAVLNDVVGETAVTIFSSSIGPTGAAYSPVVDGDTLTFLWQDGHIQDQQTDSVWNFSGQAIEGELQGKQLNALPVRSTLWFAMIAAYPDLILYAP
ncbi:MAG: DUF3179 domain-containing protein [Chloroflexi bacterium]|nr:DUF3179 domain-containing protein [Chloroflexota bacterium]